jgi:hypothetical protein
MSRVDVNTKTGWGLMRHKGIHNHPWPKAKKPDPLSKAAFKAEVMKNPKAGAFKLKVCTTMACLSSLTLLSEIGWYLQKNRLDSLGRMPRRERLQFIHH